MLTRTPGWRKAKHNNKYLVCGKRNIVGIDGKRCCSNETRPTEVAVVAWIQEGIGKVLSQREKIIKRAVEIASKRLDQSEERRANMLRDRAAIESQIEKFGRMLRMKLTDAETRGLLSQVGRLEAERDEIIRNLDALAGEASFDKRELIREIEGALDEATSSLLGTIGPAAFNAAVERFVGPIVVRPEGGIERAETVAVVGCTTRLQLPEIPASDTPGVTGMQAGTHSALPRLLKTFPGAIAS